MTSSEACKRQSSRTLFTLPLSKRKVRLGVKVCLFNIAQERRGMGSADGVAEKVTEVYIV
jgi:hypothetical protein